MNSIQSIAPSTDWIVRNLAFNLDFIPADKFTWKPAESASSAQEIVHHLSLMLTRSTLMVKGASWEESHTGDDQVAPAPSVEAAKEQLTALAGQFADAVRALPESSYETILQAPFGPIPLSKLIRISFVDAAHHHGQIAYLQTLLGDRDSHFMDFDF